MFETLKNAFKVKEIRHKIYWTLLFLLIYRIGCFIPVPGVGTESLFSLVDETHSGTIDDPIPYEKNMEIFEGLHYIQNGILYLCFRSSGQPLYHDLANLVGVYVEVVA